MDCFKSRSPNTSHLFFFVFIFLLLGISGFFHTSHADQIDRVRVGIFQNKPMCYYDDSGKPAGIFVSVVEYAAAQEGWQLNYVEDNFSNLRTKLGKGEIDILLSTAVSEERKKLYAYNEIDVFNNWAEVYVKPGSNIHSLLDLKGKVVATKKRGIYTTGPDGINKLDEKFQLKCEFILADDYLTGLMLVRDGDADAMIVNRLTGAEYGEELSLQRSGIVFASVKIRFALNKESSKTPLLIKALDKHLATLKKDPNSVYHHTISHALGGSHTHALPHWIRLSLIITAGVLITLGAFAILLRWQVKSQTKTLHDTNIRLATNERKYRRLVESTNTVPWEMDCHTREFTYMGSQAEIVFGYPADSWIDFNTWVERLHPDDKNYCIETCQSATDLGEDHEFTYRALHADGSILWIRDTVSVVMGQDGPEALVGFMHNITERIQSEDKLRQEYERTKLILETTQDGYILADATGQIIDVNPAYSSLIGYSRSELLSMNIRQLEATLTDEELEGLIQKMVKAGGARFETRHRHHDGHEVELDVNITIMQSEESPLVAAFVRDITERKMIMVEQESLQKQLAQAQKMESIGTLAGGIAHDFNNMLSAILGYTELAMVDINKPESIKSDLDEVLKGANRAKELVKQILTFSRHGDQELKPTRVQLIVHEALKLLRSSIPTTIEFRQEIDENCNEILADSTQVHQVIMNLCTNAYHAMRETGGVLTVSLQPISVTEENLGIQPHLKPGPHLVLKVKDTGIGIPKDVVGRIFDPYYSTKEIDKGTGLGLAVVHGIVTSLRGDITVSSEPGKGSTFSVYFPVIEDQYEAIEMNETIQDLPRGNEHILLVDDDETLVKLNKKSLEILGYTVTAETESSKSLTTFQNDPQRFDLVITDMTMPHMTGIELTQKIIAIRADTPVILCTGYSDLTNEEKAKELGVCEFVMKPIKASDLAHLVRKVLDTA